MIYLNVGSGKSIPERDIVGIFDMDTAPISPISRKYLSEAERAKRTESPSYEIPKSFIVYKETVKTENSGTSTVIKVCFSQFSSASLLGRVEK